MRNISVRIASLAEWGETDSSIYEKCLAAVRESAAMYDAPWAEETHGSLRALFEAAGVGMGRYSIGAYSPSHVSPEFSGDWAEETRDLTGPRAMAWIENNLLGPHRIPQRGKRRDSVRKYGPGYRPGMVPPCPFTGYCADEDFLDSLREDIAGGETLGEAFSNLADTCRVILEREIEYANSEEAVLDAAHANGWEFDETGTII